jgi:transglutaminase-like putative cysteine protease
VENLVTLIDPAAPLPGPALSARQTADQVEPQQDRDGVTKEVQLRIGYEMHYEFPQPTPVILMLNTHYTRVSDLALPDSMVVSPAVPLSGYRDGFGNWCVRLMAPAGRMTISADTIIRDSGEPDPVAFAARQVPVEDLPEEALVFLLASRFCESDKMLDLAWSLFGSTEPGWARVQSTSPLAMNMLA